MSLSHRTNALNGHPIHIHDIDGVPSLPVEVDDDHITEEVIIPQPKSRVSYMMGFGTISNLFRVVAQCLVRHRTWQNNREAGPTKEVLLAWITQAADSVRSLAAKHSPAVSGATSIQHFTGLQHANVQITSLCAEFVLVRHSHICR
jgi:hypothetical protein